MSTALDICTRAARALGFLGRQETLGAQEASDALVCLNNMLDSWSNETLISYEILQRSFPLVAGTQTYTIGSGGTINSTRPYAITQAFVRDSNNNDYPIQIITRREWDLIGTKYITSQIPTTLFYDSQYPLGVINIFPVPLIAYTVYFNSTLDQAIYALSNNVDLPVGYEPAMIFNLALQMESFGFPCLLDDKGYIRLQENASRALAAIKRANTKPTPADFDPSIISRSQATYNIYVDGFPRQS